MTDRNDPLWTARAKALLEKALGEVEEHGGGDEAIFATSAALAVLKIQMGDLPVEEMDGYPFPGEAEEPDMSLCVCPPDLVERGGFKGGCPIGHWHAAQAIKKLHA